MKLHHIRDVLAVVEAGSLRGASRTLGITQPAISRSIRDIEHELGAPLFERLANGVRLTRIGEAFLRRAKTIEAEIQRARDEVEQMKGEMTGQVSLAMSTGAAISLLAPVISNFRKRYPKVLMKFTESIFKPVEADIMAGVVDFFVGPFDSKVSTTCLSVEKLFDNRRIIVARKDHPLQNATTLKDLAAAQWIQPSLAAGASEADFDIAIEKAGLPKPEIIVRTVSALMTLLTVANSDLLTIVPIQWLDLAETAESVRPISVGQTLYAAPISIVRRPDVPLTPAAEYLCDQVRKAGLNYRPASV